FARLRTRLTTTISRATPRRMLDNRQAEPTAPAPITPIFIEETSGYTLALEHVMQSTIPYRTLGRTGERVSAIGLGGWHLGLEGVDEHLSFRIIRTAIDRGINFLDNSWDYNDGASETRMGKALRDGYRQKVFLMTKIDANYGSYGKLVLPELIKQGTGVLGMKPMENGIILKSKTVSPTECLLYAVNLPTSVVITGVDWMEILDQACEAARTFRPLSDPELTALLSRTATAAAHGEFEPFKTSSIFDGTAQNPAWLGDEPQRLQQLMP